MLGEVELEENVGLARPCMKTVDLGKHRNCVLRYSSTDIFSIIVYLSMINTNLYDSFTKFPTTEFKWNNLFLDHSEKLVSSIPNGNQYDL